MLKLFSFTKKDEDIKLKQLFNQVFQLLQGLLYKQAAIELEKLNSFSIDIKPNLDQFFEDIKRTGSLESILTVGIVVQRYRKQDKELANYLGNVARQVDNDSQAIEFYTYALQIDSSFTFALYNYAATKAKVNKYDQEIAQALTPFLKKEFIYPPFWEEANTETSFIETINLEIELVKEQDKATMLEVLSAQHVQAMGDPDEANKITKKMEAISKQPLEITRKDQIQMIEQQLSHKEERSEAWNIFSLNLSLLYLKERQYGNALAIISTIVTDRKVRAFFSYSPILYAICLYKTQNTKTAIELLYQFLNENPYNRYAFINLGKLYLMEKKWLNAFKYLLIGANLLEISGGIYLTKELEEKADSAVEQGNLPVAISYYEIIANETKAPQSWLKLAKTLEANQQTRESLEAVQKGLAIKADDPNLQEYAQTRYSTLMEEGTKAFRARKSQVALSLFSLALELFTTKAVLQKIISVYNAKNNESEIQHLTNLYDKLTADLLKERKQKQYHEYHMQAQTFLGQNNFVAAIEPLTNALEIHPTKKILSLLIDIYKRLHDQEGLDALIEKWNHLQDQQEQQKKLDIAKRQELKAANDND